jgi:hypothetical protein
MIVDSGLDAMDKLPQLLWRRSLLQSVDEARISQAEGEPGEELEMNSRRGRKEQEEDSHRLAVNRFEADGLSKDAGCDRRLCHECGKGASGVRDRHPVTKPGGRQSLAFQKMSCDLWLQVVGERGAVDSGGKSRSDVSSRDIVV